MTAKERLIHKAAEAASTKHPGLTAKQTLAIAAAVAGSPAFELTLARDGSLFDWEVALSIETLTKRDPQLTRPLPTVAQFVAHQEAEHAAKGLDVKPESRMSWAREAAELLANDPDALFDRVPADSPALKIKPAVAEAKREPGAGKRLTELSDNELAVVVCERLGYPNLAAMHRDIGAAKALQHVRYLRGQAEREERERPPAVDDSMRGKGVTAVSMDDPAFAKLSPAARISAYRRAQEQNAE
jgi:hypothetical protein